MVSGNNINILYEDKDLIVVEKPAGVLAVPLSPRRTVLPEGQSFNRGEKTIGDLVGAIPCHRLDRDTSGIMILAKNEKAKEAMQKIFAERKIKKIYTALVWGKVEPEKGEIMIPLGRGSKDRLRVVPNVRGRTSHTLYEVVKYYPESNMCLLTVDLKTGRTHQVRVHFSAIGHPVVGDAKYSNRKTELARQFLHASEISFVHPFTGEEICLKSKLSKDLKSFLSSLD